MRRNVLLVDDHPMFITAEAEVLEAAFPGVHVFPANSIATARRAIEYGEQFDLVLLDLRMADTNGLSGLLELRALYPRSKIIVISAYSDTETIRKCGLLGAWSFLPKSTAPKSFVDVVGAALGLKSKTARRRSGAAVRRRPIDITEPDTAKPLTTQQVRVLSLICAGHLNKQIAFLLGIKETTVKAHISEILRRLQVTTRTQAILEVYSIGADPAAAPT